MLLRLKLTIEEEGRREDSEEESYTRELIIPLMVHVDTTRGRRRIGGEERRRRPGRGKWSWQRNDQWRKQQQWKKWEQQW